MLDQSKFDFAKLHIQTTGEGYRPLVAFTIALQIAGIIIGANANTDTLPIWVFADHVDVKTRHQLLDMREFLATTFAEMK